MKDKKNIIGMIIPDGTNQFFSGLAQNFQRELVRHDFGVIVLNSDRARVRERQNIEMLTALDVKGLIFIAVGDNNESYALLSGLNVPMLILDREVPVENSDFLLSDNVRGVKQVADFIAGRRFERIGLLHGSLETEPGRVRHRKFLERMDANGVSENEILILSGDFQLGTGRRAAERVLKSPRIKWPHVMFCANDLMAIGFVQRMLQEGVNVPGEISVIGYDDIPMASWIYPRLTTVKQDMDGMAMNGVRLLLDRVRSQAIGEHSESNVVAIDPSLIIRESCL